jgi:hypothetical protein
MAVPTADMSAFGAMQSAERLPYTNQLSRKGSVVPVAHDAKIDLADQFGALCLSGFQGRDSLLRCAPVGAKYHGAADDSRKGADHQHGIEPDQSDRDGCDQHSSHDNEGL